MRTVLLAFLALVALTGCGGSNSAKPPTTTAAATSAGPGALQAEAGAAAAGDIPDNQVFVVFANRSAGYSMKYPEGWAQQGGGARVTIRDKNTIVRIVVGPPPASIAADVAALHGATVVEAPAQVTVGGASATKVVYATESAPNPVTGKRVRLVVDRYYLRHGAREATVDLGSPQGVDNVDAYRLMIQSFRWR